MDNASTLWMKNSIHNCQSIDDGLNPQPIKI